MTTSQENVARNASHYDHLYSAVQVDDIVSKVENLEAFLSDAIKTDTSWHGMYHGSFLKDLKGKRIFEIGCGDGLNALVMAALGADVVANDISQVSAKIIASAASRLGLKNISAVDGDFLGLQIERRSFDYVIGKAFLHHLTHDLEDQYLEKISTILVPSGAARFFEPAQNSQLLDNIRWMVPVPRRPSVLNRKKFAEWKAKDPHPARDNSTAHYVASGLKYFGAVDVVHIGSIERFHRLMPAGTFNRSYRRWAHTVEEYLPRSFRSMAARSQLLVYRDPYPIAAA